MPPTWIHRAAPYTLVPNPGTSTSIRPPILSQSKGLARVRNSLGGVLDRTHIMASPMTPPSNCLANGPYGERPVYNWLADDVESTTTRPIANNRQVAPTIRWYEASGRSNTASHGGTRFRGADPGGHSAGRGTPPRPP